jgi:predicted nucleic acid-binding protein
MQKTSTERLILDAWALLALIQGEEPAASRVLKAISEAEQKELSLHMSWINLGEVYYQVGKRRGDAEASETLEEILLLPVRFHEARKQDVLQAAQNKMRFTLSYADAFAVALTQSLDGTILTGDPEILKLDLSLKIEKLERQ